MSQWKVGGILTMHFMLLDYLQHSHFIQRCPLCEIMATKTHIQRLNLTQVPLKLFNNHFLVVH